MTSCIIKTKVYLQEKTGISHAEGHNIHNSPHTLPSRRRLHRQPHCNPDGAFLVSLVLRKVPAGAVLRNDMTHCVRLTACNTAR